VQDFSEPAHVATTISDDHLSHLVLLGWELSPRSRVGRMMYDLPPDTGNVTARSTAALVVERCSATPQGQLWDFINPFGKTRLANMNIPKSIKPRGGDESLSQIWSKGKKQQNGTPPCFMMNKQKGKTIENHPKIRQNTCTSYPIPIQFPSPT